MTRNIPLHIAIIPDGNRRWARKRGFSLQSGHIKGVEALKEILTKVIELKIRYFTFWGSSWDNLTKRSKTEANFLFKTYTKQFKKILEDKEIYQNKIKITVLGRWKEILPKETQEAIEKAQNLTRDYNNYFLTFLLAYNGTDEMIDCIQKIADSEKIKKMKITKELVKENLWTKNLPPVDLIIRTGSENDHHISAGFMMWDIAYSQLRFTRTLFPAFGAEEFEEIIKDYSTGERRYGS